MRGRQSPRVGHAIQWRQLQRRRVHQEEKPPSLFINLVIPIKDTIHIIRDIRLMQVTIR